MLGCTPLTDNQIQLILEELPRTRDKALFTLMLCTGFRIQEALSLRVQDIQEPRVRVSRRNMKGQVCSRSVLLNDKARDTLLALVSELSLEPGDFIFKSAKGANEPIRRKHAWRIVKAAVRKLGLSERIALHSTRKTFADKAYKAFNKDLIKTSKVLGHKSILSTASYLSFDTEELDTFVRGL